MVKSPIRTQEVTRVDVLRQTASVKATPLSYLTALPKSALFGTDGIRGKAGELLNAPLALQVGFWAGKVLQAKAPQLGPMILGQDSRNSSDMLANALAAGLTSAGLEVWNLGLCPTPCVAYLTSITDAVGGIMISASHNPPEDNGIKIFGSDGTKLELALQQEIEAGIRGREDSTNSALKWGKSYQRQLLVQDYANFLQRSLPVDVNLQGMKIVLDLAWGASARLAPQLFQALGAEVICLHEEPDGNQINVNCGSTHLDVLKEAVKLYSADLGFAFDGDADRAMAVDSCGNVIDGDYILYFWGQSLQAAGKLPENLIIATVMANLGFERAWQERGGKMIRTPVGDRHVHAQMCSTGAKLGGEQSGHILCHHYSITGDGIQTALHLACLVRQSGVSLADLVAESFTPYPQLLRNVRVEDRETRRNWQECLELQKAIAQAETAMGNQGRILVRASGTEPVIRVMVEAAEVEVANYWTTKLVSAVQTHLVG
ncbi:phosphoglucosamine mutase [Oscillatoria salina]|uniref:phosphoglucosamine mutase n=1 Tax=Oscillatoria salina TaxID=331517 RepID=UPI0013BDF838|nr:phosphoglucosamine mutase [Oscillatoria salina]MBZ8178509.1 phosphoglucosamine mutase [Oscillatoria salina IIICB1]NET86873.1 phosphoglucosamine mutase [Kamptonema sp. SIO1D9]